MPEKPLLTPAPVIDAHVHFWDPELLRYDWLAGVPPLNRPFLPDDHRTDYGAHAVEQLVFVQCEAQPPLSEPSWVASLAKSDPRIQAVVAKASVELGDSVEAELEQLADHAIVRGVRRLIQDEPHDEFCNQPAFVAGVKRLARFDFTFDLCIYHHQLPSVIALVGQCPEIRFVLDHIGKPNIKDRVLEPWQTQLRQLSRFPNIWCKISGITTEADHECWSADDVRPYIAHAIDCFGFDRIMFGSDWPVIRLASRPDQWLELVGSEVAHCTREEQHKLFHSNAAEFYRLSQEIDLTE